MIEITNRYTGAVLYTSDCSTLREAVILAVKSGADLSLAKLSGADLYRADLSLAKLSGADLSGADLSRANLSWAKLSGADLSLAKLSGADLYRADLSVAKLSGANLSGAKDGSICRMDFGGWSICIRADKTTIGCQTHQNEKWLGWDATAPEIARMHSNAAAWWKTHGYCIKAVILCVMAKAKGGA